MGIVQAIKDIQNALIKHYGPSDEFTVYEAKEEVPELEHMSLPGIEAAFSGKIWPYAPPEVKYTLDDLYDFK